MSNLCRTTAALLLTLLTTLHCHAAQPATAPVLNNSTESPAANPSVLERFRTYSGPRTPDDLIRLFYNPPASNNIQQQPEIALSDGITPVKLTLTLNVSDNSAPNFACVQARLISVKSVQNNVWQLEILPKAGSWKSGVVVQQGAVSSDVPLTVAPPLTGDLSINGFIAYLKSSGSDVHKRIDLNADGKSDYQDDYIYAANVLVVRNADPHDPATRNKRARELTPVRTKP